MRPTGLALLTLPFWLLLLLLTSCGIGLMAASLMVKYRDVGYVLPVVTQVLLYASPVAYSVAALPSNLRGWYQANPLSAVLEGFRWALLDTRSPRAWPAVWSTVFAALIFVAGASVFGNMERKFADVI